MNRENLERLGEHDVVMAGYPGSGAAWLGCVMVNLGLFYLDGYHEILDPSELHTTRVLDINRRDRLPDYRDRDKIHSSFNEKLRIVKTHLPVEEFGKQPKFRSLVLVRDARDSVISYFHWLRNFAGLTAELDEFIDHGHGADSKPPAQEWSDFYRGWLSYLSAESTCLVKFEDMRKAPVDEIQKFCAFLGVSRPIASITRAIHECSYSSMRAKESKAVGQSSAGEGMIMRRGEVGEWKSVLKGSSLKTIERQAGTVLKRLAY